MNDNNNSKNPKKYTDNGWIGYSDLCVCYLHGFVFPFSETPQRCEKVDVSALDELSLCLAHLLMSLSAPDQSSS